MNYSLAESALAIMTLTKQTISGGARWTLIGSMNRFMNMTKISFIACLSLFVFACSPSEKRDIEQIQATFSDWQKVQIESEQGEFLAAENCTLEYVLDSKQSAMLGFPEEINFHYADINGDEKSDALITFSPKQCDGGNAAQWMQYQLLVLSERGSYSIDEIALHPNALSLLSGPYFLDSLSGTNAYGRYYEFVQGDPRCCPSINKALTIDMNTFKVELADLPEE